MITSSFESRRRGSSGFTLTEVLIASTLSAIVLAGVLSTFVMLVKSGVRLGNYSIMEMQTRRAFEKMGVDVRMASNFEPQSFTGTQLTSFKLTIPSEDLTNPTYIIYGFDGNAGNYTFYSLNPDTSQRTNLVTSIESMEIFRFDKDYNPLSGGTNPTIKHVQVSVNVSRSGTGIATATQFIRSSAFTIRNMSL